MGEDRWPVGGTQLGTGLQPLVRLPLADKSHPSRLGSLTAPAAWRGHAVRGQPGIGSAVVMRSGAKEVVD